MEHATTAEEFALQELQRSKLQKDKASDTYNTLRRDVTTVSTQYKGVRVALINLQHNSNWNGRCGTIVKLITDGADEDVGRWKVKLDSNWRGKEPDGNYSPFEGGDGGSNVQMLSQDRRHVVAKAENLTLIDGRESGGDVPSFLEGGVKLRSKMEAMSMSEDDRGQHHPLDPVEELPEELSHHVVTPERRGGGRRRIYNNNNSHQPSSPPQSGHEYDWKRNALGSQHSPPGYYERDNSIVNHAPAIQHSLQQQWQEGSPQQGHLQRIHGHHQQHPKQQQQYSSPIVPTRSPKNSPNKQQQRVYIRNQVSSSYPEMVSPEQFTPVSFQIETSESFTQRNTSLPSSSFFDEVSQHEDTQNVHNLQHYSYQDESIGHNERSNAGRSLQAPSTTPPNSLPTVVILPVDEEDARNRDGPPTCVGVQNAGISHVNGLYALTQNNDQDEESSQQQPNASNNADVPPLYFRDAEPILLSDGRYYDMCILRIDCPDSPEYVIWFLSRVDVDPNCLDVKFSDCYYYCRVLRSVGLHAPPMEGWNIPDVHQPDAVAFSTADDDDEEEASPVRSGHRVENDQARLHSSMSSGLGIVPRSAEGDYV